MRVRFPLGPRTLKSTDAIAKVDEPTFVQGLRYGLMIFTYLLCSPDRELREAPPTARVAIKGVTMMCRRFRSLPADNFARRRFINVARAGSAADLVFWTHRRTTCKRSPRHRASQQNRRMALRKSRIAPLCAINDGPGL
jgi:hypothetical protein